MSSQASPLVEITQLCVTSPDGRKILDDVELTLEAGEVVVLLGGSGAGKSTLLDSIRDPEQVAERGLSVSLKHRALHAAIGVVPQRGALFDHLDAAQNLALALRNAQPPGTVTQDAIASRLEEVDLPRAWAQLGQSVAEVSGGEAQRLAVARTLAGGRRILFFDEPSVGLDPLRVRRLGALLRKEIRANQAGALIITHDLPFAAAVADRFLVLERATGRLVELVPPEGLAGPQRSESAPSPRATLADTDLVPAAREPRDDVQVERWLTEELLALLERDSARVGSPSSSGGSLQWLGQALTALGSWLAVPAQVLAAVPQAVMRPRDLIEVLRPVLKQALWRPLPFFAALACLAGFTILYVFDRSLSGGEIPIRPDRLFAMIGSMHIIALAPPLAAITYSATSGNAITAWLGGMSLTRQSDALRALGIAESRYLWLPCAVGLFVGFWITALVVVWGMVGGGLIYFQLFAPELGNGFEILTADLLDPPPARAAFRMRAIGLIGLYALGIATDAVHRGRQDKRRSEDVTIAMVRSVMTVTLYVAICELGTLAWLYTGR